MPRVTLGQTGIAVRASWRKPDADCRLGDSIASMKFLEFDKDSVIM